MPEGRLVDKDGKDQKVLLAEMRDNNRALNSRVTELEEKLAAYGDITPESAQAAIAAAAKFEGLDAGTDGTPDGWVGRRTTGSSECRMRW